MKAATKLERDYTYGDPLIDATFKRAIYTGLRDSTARVHLKAMLKVCGKVSDKELIDELNKVSPKKRSFHQNTSLVEQERFKRTRSALTNV